MANNTVAELVFIPAPLVDHIVSAIEIAKLLVNRDQCLSVTVLIIKLPPIATYIESLTNKSIDRISFIELKDETQPKLDSKNPMTSFNEFINSHCKYVRNVVADMIGQPGSARVAGFVIDMLCTSMIDVADEFNVPTYVYFSSSAAFLGFKLYIETLCDDQNQDVIELSNSNGEILIPTFIKPVPTKVFPSMVRTRDGVDIFLSSSRKLTTVRAIIVNTFLELETHAIESLSSDSSIPRVYTVGPLINLEGGAGKSSDDDAMRWLDDQPPASVVVLCFGSMGSFGKVQIKEIAHGLERSGHRFVWSLCRPPSDDEDPKVILWLGVPSATWPLYAEQQMNAFEMVVELGLAVEIKLDYKIDLFNPQAETVIVGADEIEGGIRRLMADETIRTKVKEMSEKSRATMADGGLSYASVGYLILDFIKNIS
ncbi:hypothetical protein L6452_32812 [Arctium lappa]|uniref:Uncharacterized protein n=1 Tax=Arctium lappa TaxID=4217 RepID=A0ACB8Z6A0_ARCLA|nr:hypothetical protein L6452_32812 [Arctium lappa]